MSWRRASSPSRCTACTPARRLSPSGLGRRFAVERLGRVQPGLDALGERDFLLGREQRDLADLLEVHAHRVEAAALGVRDPADERTAASSASAFAFVLSSGARDPAPGRLVPLGRCSRCSVARRRGSASGATGSEGSTPARRWSSSCNSSAISSSTLMPRDSNMSHSSRSSLVSGSRSGNAAKISPVVMKPRSRTWSSTPTAADGCAALLAIRGRGCSGFFGLSRLGHRHHGIRAAPTR